MRPFGASFTSQQASTATTSGRSPLTMAVDPAALSALIAGTASSTTANGELVLVRIGWKQTGSSSDAASEAENASADSQSPSADDSESTDPVQTDTVPMVAMGIARSEPEAS